MAVPSASRLTFADYVSATRDSDIKHEFLDGEMWAMSGGSPAHAQIALHIGGLLFGALRSGACRTFSSDLRVRVPSGAAFYPDVSVVCGPLECDPEDGETVTNPALIVEVLSPGTEAFDRGQKFAAYQEIPSLRGCLLVSQHEPRVEMFTRQGDGSWRYAAYGPGERLSVLDVAIAVDAVYENVELTPAPRREARPR